MKRIILPALICLGIFFCGCAPSQQGEPITAEIEYVAGDYWPENAFTAGVPRPDYGETEWILDESDLGRYTITFREISREQSEAYIEELKAQGFEEYMGEGNDVSVGYLLKRENKFLSIAFSGESMGFMIILED